MPRPTQRGVTLVEMLIAVLLSALLLSGFARLYRTTLDARAAVQTQRELMQEARFAMNRMVDALQATDRLILPLNDRSNTDWNESLRQQDFPESAAQAGSSRDTAVLAMAIPATQDLDLNGIADADNDGDGRIDEDWSGDVTNDGANGIVDIDDNGNGQTDETSFGVDRDDDEYLSFPDEDPLNGVDDDGDGSIDEDSGADMNGDRAPGIEDVDDDGDGAIDEGDDDDDDEDGQIDEDWLDAMVFYLNNDILLERRPSPLDANRDGVTDGQDYVIENLATDVTRLRFERLQGTPALIEIELHLSRADTSVQLTTRVRAGTR
ncbi:MAG: prepilin-type N-terminal cleavage/methylation domain-containing protein [Gammaproteobacteria bacterium]